MDFTYTDEQNEFRAVVRSFLAALSAEADVRRVMASDSGIDEQLWLSMAQQLGLQGVSVPEEYGGAGMGIVELGIAAEELGGALACVPFFSTSVLATHALLLSTDDKSKQRWLPQIVDGTCIATVAVAPGSGDWDLAVTGVTATDSGGWRLSGRKTFVVDGHRADLILVAARTDDGIGLFAVERDAPGFSAEAQPTMDQTRRFATIELHDVPAEPIELDAGTLLPRLRDIALTVLAAEQIGGAQRCLDMAVDYAKTRLQFGRPIGSFQAIKHKCADILMLIESGRAASGYALWCAQDEPGSLPLAASMAKATCSEAYFRAAADNIQIHGGIGFTWEHPAHLYFKRAKSSELWLGDPVMQRERISQLLDLKT